MQVKRVAAVVLFAGTAAASVYWARGREARATSDPIAARQATPEQHDAGLPVFPGAEGFGTRTRAGRGGKVFVVSSLADSGPHTLRAALLDSAPKTIVFRTSGIIELKSHLFIQHPFVTIAGQTAPGDGIVLKDFGLVITTNDVLIQHIRVRPGNQGAVRPDHNDAIAILGRNGSATGAHHVVLDHVSTSWGEDETISTWFAPHDITISWSIVSEALNRSRHPKRTHSAGLIVGDRSDRISIHHSLLAHNDFRNPLLASGGTHSVVNNVIYNWGSLATEIVDDAPGVVNIAGNYYKPGPSTESPHAILINPSGEGAVPQLFVAHNTVAGRGGGDRDPWSLVQYGWKGRGAPVKYRAPAAVLAPGIGASPAEQALTQVLAGAGALLPVRDAVDARIVADVVRGTGSIIDSPDQVGGYPTYRSGVPPRDSDDDGIPDDWERQAGLDPSNRADGSADRDGNGYTNLEDYLHSLTR